MIHHFGKLGRIAAVSSLALAAACGGGDAADQNADDSLMTSSGAAAGDTMAGGSMAGGMNDNTIVGMASGSNGVEIATSQIAREKARNADVRQFATMMIEDHQRMQGQVDSIVQAMNLQQAPVPDSIARHLEQGRTQLQGQAAGAEFDRMYMQMQVASHQNTLNALRSAQSAVQNAQLRTVIDGAIPVVERHLERARAIASNLGG